MANKPILQTSADLSASQTAGAATLVMPTGVVLPFAGSAAPSGWLACDGSAVSRTTYASLFAALGGVASPYGLGDGSTTFNLPDFRGRFPRFNDSMFGGAAAGRDTGRVAGSAQGQATAKNGLSANASGSNLNSSISGSANSGVNLSHTHSLDDPGFAGVGVSNREPAAGGTGFYGRFSGNGVNPRAAPSGTLDHGHSLSGSADAQSWSGSTSLSGDAETRPINLAVSAIIKI